MILAKSNIWRSILASSSRSLVLFGALLFGAAESYNLLRTFLRDRSKFLHVHHRQKPPTISSGHRYGQHSFAEVQPGVTLEYMANGKKGAPLVLMIHGWPECWWSWRHQLSRLGDNYYAVAFNQRGYGLSSKPQGIQNYGERHLVEDARGLIRYLGYDKCVVIGHDWGGTVAWNFAMRHSAMVDKLIVLNCPHPAVLIDYFYSFRHWPSWWYMFYFQLSRLPELSWSNNDFKRLEILFRSRKHGIPDRKLMTDADIEMYKYTFSQPGCLRSSINYYRAQWSYRSLKNILTPTSDRKLNLSKVKPPTMILWGQRDAVLTPDMADASLRHCENAQLRYFSEASHWLQQHEPEAVNEAILNFLNH